MKKAIKIKLPFIDKQKNDYLVLGHFNAIHKGHYNLFKNLKSVSFLIFENNPSKTYSLYNLNERIQNLQAYHPKNIYVYDILTSNLSCNDFIEKVLKQIHFKSLVVGDDFYFGKNKEGNVALLQKHFDVKVFKKDELSTSKINLLLQDGKIEEANKLLMNFFYYQNTVVKGKQIARKIFKPTANILDNKNVDIKNGSYASITIFNNKIYPSISFIGIPKSFEETRKFVETHIFDFEGNLYNKKIKVYPLKFLRENEKFNDINDLKKAIEKDFLDAQKYFEKFNLKDFKQ